MLKIIHSLCLLSRLSISRCRITIVSRRKYAPYDRCPSLNHRRRKYPRPRRYDSTLSIFEKKIFPILLVTRFLSPKSFSLPSPSKREHQRERKKKLPRILYHSLFSFFSFLQKKHDIVLTALVFQST